MVEISVAVTDLGRVRFVIDPLWEAVSSVFALHCPDSRAVHHRLRSLVADVPDTSTELLDALCVDTSWVPDLLAPEPDPSLNGDPVACLSRVAQADLDVVERDLAVLRDRSTPPTCAQWDADTFRRAVADALLAFWKVVLAPLWDRARLVAEADIGYRSQQLAAEGITATLNDLHPKLSSHGDRFEIDCRPDTSMRASGGVWLIPSVFRWPGFVVQFETARPVICYAARGAGRVWLGRVEPGDAVSTLLGQGRARVLAAVALPTNTTQIAGSLALSKATVSEHLSALADAQLVTSQRSGRHVLYARTGLGDELLGG